MPRKLPQSKVNGKKPFREGYFSGDFAFNHSESEYTCEDPHGPLWQIFHYSVAEAM
jgi:hypothetical protein